MWISAGPAAAQGSFSACGSLWVAARVSLPLQWHPAVLHLTPDKTRIQRQISQLTSLIKENNVKEHSSLEPLPPQRCPWCA